MSDKKYPHSYGQAWKTFGVRNTERPIPQSKVRVEKSGTSSPKNAATQRHTNKLEDKATTSKVNLDMPELQTALRVAEMADLIERTKRVTNPDIEEKGKQTIKEKVKIRQTNKLEDKVTPSKVNFDMPELHTALRVAEMADLIERAKPVTTPTDIEKKGKTIKEKVTKKVNIQYDKPVFKDLMPLSEEKVGTKPKPPRNPRPKKDEEPVLADFITPREVNEMEYAAIPEVEIPAPPSVIINRDTLRLYRLLQQYHKF